MENVTAVTQGTTWSRGEAFRHVDPPQWSFFPGGLLPLVGLFALMLFATTRFATGWIEEEAWDSIRLALDVAGHEWAELEVSGQTASLSGPAPSTQDGNAAMAIASQATCSTWIGPRVCATSVNGSFSEAPGTATASPAAGAEATPTAVGSNPTPTSTPAATAAQCESDLEALLATSRIDFAVGSATLVASSGPLLDDIAAVAATCPGTIQVEGHTDNTGDADANQRLSLARARAVRSALSERGVPTRRLTAVGVGAAQPIASNETAEGRAKNRRIEFRITSDNNE